MPSLSQSAAPVNPPPNEQPVELPQYPTNDPANEPANDPVNDPANDPTQNPFQDPPEDWYENNPLCYDSFQMANFILDAGEPLFAPHLPPIPTSRQRLWRFLMRIIGIVDPEINSIFLGMAYYKAMLANNRIYYHPCARPDSLLATAIMLAEKVVRDCPPRSPTWEEATGFRYSALDELERAWLGEIGYRAMSRRWDEEMTAWRELWEAYVEMHQGEEEEESA